MTTELFIAFSDEDLDYISELEIFFQPMIVREKVQIWHHKKIVAGKNKMSEINAAIDKADIVLYMVSSNFLASEYYHAISTRIQQRQNKGLCRLVPIILRFAFWELEDFSELNCLPSSGDPITAAPDVDKMYKEVVIAIGQLVKSFGKERYSTKDENASTPPPSCSQSVKHSKMSAIKQLITSGKISKAVEVLLQNTTNDQELQNSIYNLQAQFNRLQKERNINVISYKEYTTSLNKIVYGLIEIVDML